MITACLLVSLFCSVYAMVLCMGIVACRVVAYHANMQAFVTGKIQEVSLDVDRHLTRGTLAVSLVVLSAVLL